MAQKLLSTVILSSSGWPQQQESQGLQATGSPQGLLPGALRDRGSQVLLFRAFVSASSLLLLLILWDFSAALSSPLTPSLLLQPSWQPLHPLLHPLLFMFLAQLTLLVKGPNAYKRSFDSNPFSGLL